MTKALMNSILTLIADNASAEAEEVRQALTAELDKGKAKAEANKAFYEDNKDIVLNALSDTPVTIAELYEEIKGDLPQDFTKSKVQYAITRLWADEVVKTEGKVNTYSRKG